MLRTRLFLSLLPFVVILLALCSFAIALFSHLANNVDQAVTRNYQSILTSQAMAQALEGMERELPEARLAQGKSRRLFVQYQKRFEANLAAQRTNTTPAGVHALNKELTDSYKSFLESLHLPNTLRSPKDQPSPPNFGPDFSHMNILVQQIRNLNYRAVVATNHRIQKTTRNVTRLLLIGVFLVLLVSAFTCYQLSRSIVRPIQTLTRAVRELGDGHAVSRVPVTNRDELGELAVSFNDMAAQLENYRQSTSKEILRLHETMESTLASFPDPIFVLNRQGRVELKNPAAEHLAAALCLSGQLPDRLQGIARSALESGRDFLPNSFKEAVSYRIDEAEKSFLPRILTMHDQEKGLFGVAVVLYDVTRFRLMDAAKTNLVAAVSHELKTPLTSIRMALHLLLEQSVGTLTLQQNELLQTARNDTERLLRILNNLLDLARLEEGHDGFHKENVTPMELLRGVIEESAKQVTARSLRLNCTIEPDLPPVSVDLHRIHHVFANFISNAIKHSPVGGEILVSATRVEDNCVEFSVSDQGPGVPEEFQLRIFDRFFRVPGQTKTGAGLGLSIAREIIAAHGGRIGVRNAPDGGGVFFVILKAADADVSVKC